MAWSIIIFSAIPTRSEEYVLLVHVCMGKTCQIMSLFSLYIDLNENGCGLLCHITIRLLFFSEGGGGYYYVCYRLLLH